MTRTRRISGITLALVIAVGSVTFAASPASAKAPAATKVTLSSVTTKAGGPFTAGQIIIAQGTASKNLKGKRVYLQRKTGKTWLSTGYSTVVPSTLAVSLNAKAQGVGHTVYRLITKKTSSLKAAASKTKGATVYRWLYLSKMSAKHMYIATNGSTDINGVTYPSSVIMDRNNTFDSNASYNLKRECLSFAATSGVPDSYPISNKANQLISLDGTVVSNTIVSGGTSNPISMDVTGALELKLERDYSSTAFGGLAFGNAQVLCSF